MTEKERDQVREKLIASLNFWTDEAVKARTEGDENGYQIAVANRENVRAELEKIQPRNK